MEERIEKLNSIMGKIAYAMFETRNKKDAIDRKKEELAKETVNMRYEEINKEITDLETEKNEYDEMTVRSLKGIKENITEMLKDIEKENIDKLTEFHNRRLEIETKKKKIEARREKILENALSEEKVEVSAQNGLDKIEEELAKLDNEQNAYIEKYQDNKKRLKTYDKTIEEYAVELNVKLEEQELSEPEIIETEESSKNESEETNLEDEPVQEEQSEKMTDPRVGRALDNLKNLENNKDGEEPELTVPEMEHEEARKGRHFSKAEPSESLNFTYDDEPKARHFSKPEAEKTPEATRAVRTPEMIVNKISREIPEMEERKNQYEEELAKQINNLGEDSKGVEQLKGMIANLENAIETRKTDIEKINNSTELTNEDFDELYQKYNIGVFDKITVEAKKDELPAKVNKSKFAEIFEGAKGKIQQVWDKLKSLVKHKDKDNTKSDKSDSTER